MEIQRRIGMLTNAHSSNIYNQEIGSVEWKRETCSSIDDEREKS